MPPRPTRRLFVLPVLLLAAALWWSAAAFAHPPYCLVADPAGNVYFSDLEAVWRLAPDGRLSLFRPATEGTHVHELALAPDGAIEGDLNRYEASTQTYYAAIWRRSPEGRESWVLRQTASPPQGTGLARDAAGNRYLAQWVSNDDRRTMLFRRAADGKVALLFGPRDKAAKFRQVVASSVGGMAFAADGALIFADGRALRRVAPSGAVTTLYEGPEGASLRGVSVAPDGRLVVADIGRSSVLAVSADGQAETLHSSQRGWMPTAAAFARGRLLVLEANADAHDYENRVRVIEVKDGTGRVVALPAKGPSPGASAEPRGGGGAGGTAELGNPPRVR